MFLQIDTIILGDINNKFTISSQYIKKEVSDEVDFFACRWTSKFLDVDTFVFDGSDQTCPKYPKYDVGNVFAIS